MLDNLDQERSLFCTPCGNLYGMEVRHELSDRPLLADVLSMSKGQSLAVDRRLVERALAGQIASSCFDRLA